MRNVTSELITEEHTKVLAEERIVCYAPHNYQITTIDGQVLADIHFQEGPIKECGVNGIHHQDLIAMVIDRLEHFQNSPYKCEENQKAICLLEDILRVLRERTNKRKERGVVGTSAV